MDDWAAWKVKENFFPDTFYPQTLLERMRFYHTPGASLAVIQNNQLEWVEAFGLANSSSGEAVTPQTLFQAASISKPVTAVAVLKLVEQGLLDLEADTREYLLSWRAPWQEKITLRHLLSHTSGLNVHGYDGYPNGAVLPTVPQILNGEAPANSEALKLEHPPASQMSYSGGGYTLLQLILEDVCKKQFAQIMSELLLEPLGMTRSSFLYPRDGFATAHPQQNQPLEGSYHLYPEMAAAGLWTTPTDLAKFGLALLKDTFLSRSSLEKMLSPQSPELKDSQSFMGLGFVCERKNGIMFLHNGWNEGFVAQIRLYQDKGAILMLNSNAGFPILEEAMNTIARVYEWQ